MSSTTADNLHFKRGKQCLLVLMGQHYWVSVLDADPKQVRVSFPVSNFPIEGMSVKLEFHDDQGYTCYEAEVLHGPEAVGDGLLLRPPDGLVRTWHRSSWRVPTKMKVHVKSHIHPRSREVDAVNLSAGGVLMRSSAAYTVGEGVEIKLPVEGVNDTLTGEVVHVASSSDARKPGALIGVRFVSPDPILTKALSRYVTKVLHEMYPVARRLKR